MRKLLGMAVVFAVALSSCKKDEVKVCELNQSNLLGTYKPSALKYKASPSSPEEDLYLLLEACEKDDLVVLNSNNTFNYVDGGTQCVPAGDGTGSWTLSGNTFNIYGQITTVSSFTCSELIFTAPGPIPGSIRTATWVRQ